MYYTTNVNMINKCIPFIHMGSDLLRKSIKYLSFIGLVIAMFMGILDSTVINVTLPSIQNYFGATMSNATWVSTSYLLSVTVFMLPSSKIADQHGRKKLILLGLMLFGGFSLASALSKTLEQLVIFRFVQGIGGAIITPLILPIGVNIFGNERLPMVASVGGAISALAAAGGPPIGGLILHYLNWRWVFGINIPFAIISFLIILFFVNESYDETASKKIDFLGITTLSISMLLIVFALLKSNDFGWHSVVIITSLITGLFIFTIYCLIEKRSDHPMFDFKLFKERTFTNSCIVYGITGFSLVCPTLVLNYFLQDALRYSALKASLITVVVSLTVMISMPLGTKIASKVNANLVNCLGLILIATSLILLSTVRISTPIENTILFLIINGFGFGFTSQSLVSSVKHLPVSKNGLGSGMVNTARQFGTCLGVAVLMTFLSSNVSIAKTNIYNKGKSEIENSTVSTEVKKELNSQLRKYTKNGTEKISYSRMAKNNSLKGVIEKGSNKPTSQSIFFKLYNGNEQLLKAEESMTNALTKEKSPFSLPMERLIQSQKIVLKKIGMISQFYGIQEVMKKIKSIMNKQIALAFSKVYLLCAGIVALFIPFGLGTDKRENK